MKPSTRRSLSVVIALFLSAGVARAEVTRVDIKTRADVGVSGYEKIIGTIHFAVDPNDPRNRVVVDLDKAPVNASGRVEFSSDLYILKPKAPMPSNGAALVDVLNRGRKVVLNGFDRGGSPDPVTENDLGDRFLMRFGFTIVWVGWEFDVAAGPETMAIHVPIATDRGKTITGVVRAAWTASAPHEGIRGDRSRHVPRDRSGRRRALVGGVSGVPRHDMPRVASGQLARQRSYGDARHRLRARQDVSNQLSRGESTGRGPWIRRHPRHGRVAEESAGRARAGALRLRLRLVAERTLPAQLHVRRLQHRRAQSSGVRRRDGAHRRRRPHRSQRAVVQTDRPRRAQCDVISIRGRVPARPADRRAGRRTRQPAHGRPRAESVLHEHAGRVLGHRPRRGARAHDAGRHGRPSAAGERPRLFHRRHAARTGAFSARDHERAADRQRRRLLVDDARAAAGDAQVGEGRRRATGEPVSAD